MTRQLPRNCQAFWCTEEATRDRRTKCPEHAAVVAPTTLSKVLARFIPRPVFA